MAILLRSNGSHWQRIDRFQFATEAELQKLLHDSPELLSDGDRKPAVFIREAGLPGSGSTDLIGVDTDGRIMIVETKLAKNSEIRRKVIGQVIEYAAHLWGMSFDDFDQRFISRAGKPLIELLQNKSDSTSVTELREQITANLASGAFELLIAVDAMNTELEKIIAYLSSRGTGLRLEAMELEVYKKDDVEMVVPHRHGQLVQPNNNGGGSRRPRTLDEVLDSCADEKCREFFNTLYSEWTSVDNSVVFGTVGASFRSMINGEERIIFWAYPEMIQAGFGSLVRSAGAPKQLVDEYRNQVATIPGVNPQKIRTLSLPLLPFKSIKAETVAAFLESTFSFLEKWQSSSAS